MHRSRLAVVLIDHPDETHDRATTFWAGALGTTVQPAGDSEFTEVARTGGFEVAMQRLGSGESRVHLDFESDDIDAEVSRLTDLGATVTRRLDGCVIMTDPGGVVFCVVGIQSAADFERYATTWP
ncbi:VOC family protein [Propionibacteriaceae bacterium Y1685]|uniref:VOC family protein n=1 Tax=Microlunatus sp. Y1700 TaxID=3418487 RepID=UPI003B7657A3